jgi:hypothetical protein
VTDYVVEEAVQILGGYGFHEDYPVAGVYHDGRCDARLPLQRRRLSRKRGSHGRGNMMRTQLAVLMRLSKRAPVDAVALRGFWPLGLRRRVGRNTCPRSCQSCAQSGLTRNPVVASSALGSRERDGKTV